MAKASTYVFRAVSVEDTKRAAAVLGPHLQPGDAVVLSGDLGAGKTQFVQGVAAALGVRSAVVSPTFNLLLTYTEGALPLYHFDLYRLDDACQLEDIGYYDTVDADGACFIEWGEKFPDELPDSYIDVVFSVEQDGSRTIRARACGTRAQVVLDAWAHEAEMAFQNET